MMTHINLGVLRVLRDTLREKGTRVTLSDVEYDALTHANAKLEAGPEFCQTWPLSAQLKA